MYFKGFPRFIINKLKTRNMSIADPHKAEVKGQKQKEKGQKAEWGKENNLYMLTFNFMLGLNFISLCFGVW